jgi:hypothetical protein
MGTIFEELIRRFNEENNEEAGEHWTPRDAVRLMANLIFLPIADQIESGTYLSVPCADWNSCQAGHTHNYWQMPDEPIHLEQFDGE